MALNREGFVNIKDLALIFGIAAVLVASVLLLWVRPDLSKIELPNPDLEVSALPRTLEGFTLQEYLERVEPVLPGERFSSVAFFLPEEGKHPQVLRLGMMLYHFQTSNDVASGLNLVALGNTLEPLRLSGYRVFEHRDPEAGQVNLYWPQGASLVQILAASATGGTDLEATARAAAEVMVQVIAAQTP